MFVLPSIGCVSVRAGGSADRAPNAWDTTSGTGNTSGGWRLPVTDLRGSAVPCTQPGSATPQDGVPRGPDGSDVVPDDSFRAGLAQGLSGTRLSDLIRPHLDGVDDVVEIDSGAAPLTDYLHLPAGVRYRREPAAPVTDGSAAAAKLGTGDLVVVLHGPDRRRHGAPEAFAAAAAATRPGARMLLVLGHRPTEVPLNALIDTFVEARLQVLAMTSLEYEHLHCAALLQTVETSPPTVLRLTAEHAFYSLVARAARTRLDALEAASAAVRSAGPEASQLSDSPVRAAQLERVVEARDRRIAVMQQKIEVLETSTSLALGRALVGAARTPGRGLRTLPRELYGLWRRRTAAAAPVAGAAVQPATGAAGTGFDGEQPVFALDRLLAHTAVAVSARTVPVVAGVLSAATAETLRGPAGEPRAVVNTLLPHDGPALLSGTDPDVVLIEAAALQPPGPWSHATQGALVGRDRVLHDLAAGALAAGRPLVVWWNAPRHHVPGLARIAALADASWTPTDWNPGTVAPEGGAELLQWFLADAPRVRLDELCVRLGLRFDPLAPRRVAVLAGPGQPWLPAALAAQLHRPARVVLTPGAPPPEAFAELAALGVEIVATGSPPEALDPSALAGCTFLARWERPSAPPAGWLIELLAAVEARSADAAAPLPGGLGSGAADDAIRPLLDLDPADALVRCELAVSQQPSERWAAAGARLLGVPALPLPGELAR